MDPDPHPPHPPGGDEVPPPPKHLRAWPDGIPGWHIIIKGPCHQHGFALYKDISGCCIGEHKEGLVQKERPHYHVWVPREKFSRTEARAAVRSFYEPKTPDTDWNRSANACYSCTPHTSFTAWVDYVFGKNTDCKKPTVMLWNSDTPRPPSFDELVYSNVLTYDAGTITVQKAASKKAPAYQRFYDYCKDMKWYVPGGTDAPVERKPTKTDIVEAWFDWTQGAYEMRNVSAPIRYAYYMLNDRDERIKNEYVSQMLHLI